MIRRELILPMAISFSVGVATTLLVTNSTGGKMATARDVIDSYLRGQRDALSTKNPTAELEAACAGLWLQNSTK